MAWLILGAGFVVLLLGGEVLVRGGSGLGRFLRLSPQVIGLTVVAFATSAPELAVSLNATASGSAGLAIGNVVGSNIANILLVLGMTAVILPGAVQSPLVRREIPVMILAAAMLLITAFDGLITRSEGLFLLAGLGVFLALSIITERRKSITTASPTQSSTGPAGDIGNNKSLKSVAVNVLFVAVGVGLLVLGAHSLVSAATQIASAAGLSDLVIGLTVVAIGTSLPELATSAIAAVRGKRELAIGNIVGSNLFNIGAVVGLTALVSQTGIPVHRAAITFDLPAMLIVSLAVLPIAFTGMRITRWEGGLFLTYYAAYITYLLLDATEHDALPAFSTTLLVFALPLTAVTLFLLAAHQMAPKTPRSNHTAKHHASESPDLDNPT